MRVIGSTFPLRQFCDTTEQLLFCQYFEHATSGHLSMTWSTILQTLFRDFWGRWVGIVVEPLLEQASKFRGFAGLVVAEVALTDERKSADGFESTLCQQENYFGPR